MNFNKINPQKKYYRRLIKTERNRVEQSKAIIDILALEKLKNERETRKSIEKMEKLQDKIEAIKNSSRVINGNPRAIILERR